MIEVGKRYKSENGSEWECVAVRGDIAWQVGVYDDRIQGSAYSFKTDGTPICLYNNSEYRIKFDPVVECVAEIVELNGKSVRVEYQLFNGKPDFTQARIEEA